MPLLPLPAHRSVRLTTAAGAVIAIGSLGTAVAVAETGTPTPAPSSSSIASPPAPPAHRGDRPGHGGPGRADVVTAVGNDSLTVRTMTGTTKTYRVTSATKIHRGPATALQLSDLRVGDRVGVRATTDGGSTAADIDQHLAHLDGIVTAVEGDTVTITDRDGFTRVVHLQDGTTYASSGTSAPRSAVTAGKQVRAEGRVASDRTSLDASRVDVSTPGEQPAAKAKHGASPAPGAAPGSAAPTPPDGGVGGS
jgi:endonuclease YncB( thermonuclease family)